MKQGNNRLRPPSWVDKFLRWRLPEEQFEEVQGDMHELYYQWVSEVGGRKATWCYILNGFTFLRSLPKKHPIHKKINSISRQIPLI